MLRKILYIILISSLIVSCNEDQRNSREEKEKAAKYDSLVKEANSGTQSAASIYKDCISAIVTIMTDNNALGSGFFVRQNVIATNYHVIKGSKTLKIKIADSGELFNVSGYVAVDIPNDLILLECEEAKRTPLIVSNSLPETGDQIFVIGSPLGLEASFSNGIISGLRNTGNIKLIQLTAPISPGNSGGPVLNKKEEVIGISEMQLRLGQNLNFAIPSQTLNTLISFIESYSKQLETLRNIDISYFSEENHEAGNKVEENSSSNESSNYDGQYLFKTTFDHPPMFPPLREKPSSNSREVYSCPINATVFVIDNKEDSTFFKVYVNGYTGFVSKGFLKRQW